MEEIHWYALYVRMHHEKKTAEQFKAIGVEHFLPVQEVVRQWSDRKKKMTVVVIPMLIFVHVTEKQRIELLKQIPALTGTLMDRCTRKPAIIRQEEMDRFIFMLDYSEESIHFSNEPMKPGEDVIVIKGPLNGLVGQLVTLNGKTQITVRLEQLGYATVEMPIGFVQKLSANGK